MCMCICMCICLTSSSFLPSFHLSFYPSFPPSFITHLLHPLFPSFLPSTTLSLFISLPPSFLPSTTPSLLISSTKILQFPSFSHPSHYPLIFSSPPHSLFRCVSMERKQKHLPKRSHYVPIILSV